MWRGSSNTLVEGNTFFNCQREIAFGLEPRTPHDHSGGIVRNNFMYREATLTNGDASHGSTPDIGADEFLAVANRAPTVWLSSPATGVTYTSPAPITLSAEAADRDGSVTRVEFFSGGVLVGTDIRRPYTQARLRLYGRVGVSGSFAVRVMSSADAGWSESMIAWNDKPPVATGAGTLTLSDTAGKWYSST